MIDRNSDEYKDMSDEEFYYATQSIYDPSYEEKDLPSTFMKAEPSRADEINFIQLPQYKVNEEVVLHALTEAGSQCETFEDLLDVISEAFYSGKTHGVLSEKRRKLLNDIQMFDMEVEMAEQGMELQIQLIDEGEFPEDGEED